MQKKCLRVLCGLAMISVLAHPAVAWDELEVTKTSPDTAHHAVGAKAAIVMDADSGRVLMEQDAKVQLEMASTTKIMSALITLEQPDLDAYFTVDTAAIHTEGSSMGLKEGDQVSLRALAYGMLLPSGNDAANAAAVRVGGTQAKFVQMMNARAAEIGMGSTKFANPSGLGDPEHYSTAYDMALLAREALKNSLFREICSQPSANVAYGNPPYARWMKNHNRLVRENSDIYGVKTGFTKAAGRCLVSAAERDGINLIVVTLGCPDDWTVHRELYDEYFGKLERYEIGAELSKYAVNVTGGTAGRVALTCDPAASVTRYPGEEITSVITVKQFLYAPVEKGEVAGMAELYSQGQLIACIPLVAEQAVTALPPEPNFWEKLFQKRKS